MERINQHGKRKILDLMEETGGVAEIAVEDLQLIVITPGQTQFNIFQDPADSKHELIINGHLYFLGEYTIGAVGLNIVLNWNNQFPLSLSDSIIFRKYLTA